MSPEKVIGPGTMTRSGPTEPILRDFWFYYSLKVLLSLGLPTWQDGSLEDRFSWD